MSNGLRVEISVCKEVWVSKAHRYSFPVAGRRRSGIQCSDPYVSNLYSAFITSSCSPFLLQQETEGEQNILGLVLKAECQLQHTTSNSTFCTSDPAEKCLLYCRVYAMPFGWIAVYSDFSINGMISPNNSNEAAGTWEIHLLLPASLGAAALLVI